MVSQAEGLVLSWSCPLTTTTIKNKTKDGLKVVLFKKNKIVCSVRKVAAAVPRALAVLLAGFPNGCLSKWLSCLPKPSLFKMLIDDIN